MQTREITGLLAKLSLAEQSRLLKRLPKVQERADSVLRTSAPTYDPSKRPVAYCQRAMWVQDKIYGGTSAYNVSLLYQLRGDIDAVRLEQALNALADRHEILKACFPQEMGRPRLEVLQRFFIQLQQVAVDGSSPDERMRAAAQWVRVKAKHHFNLSTGPLIEVSLIPIEEGRFIFHFLVHHSVCDGGSISILLRDLGLFYHGAAPDVFAPLTSSYADFAAWQTLWIDTPAYQSDLNYWSKQLRELPVTELRQSGYRQEHPTPRGCRMREPIGEGLSAAVRDFASSQCTTAFVVYLAAFKTLLLRYTSHTDIVVGCPFEGRVRPQDENLVGAFINPLPLRTDLSGDPAFTELCARVGTTITGALTHQTMPFDKIIEHVRPVRDVTRTPLFQIFFNRFGLPSTAETFPELSSAPLQSDTVECKFDLTFFVSSEAAAPSVSVVYRTSMYQDEFVRGLVRDYLELLEQAVKAPQLRISCHLPVDLRAKPRDREMRAMAEADDTTLFSRLNNVARKFPTRPAVVDESGAWTYSMLMSAVGHIYSRLRQTASKPRAPVGLLAGNSAAALAAIIATLKAGHFFVPLDPTAPPGRLREIVASTGLTTVLVGALGREQFVEISSGLEAIDIDEAFCGGEGISDSLEDDCEDDARLAYVLFTSGSTGRPKGVMQSCANVLQHAAIYAQSLDMTPSDRVSLVPWLGFDAAIMDIFGSLLSGACLYAFDVRRQGLLHLSQEIEDQKLTVLHLTPTVLRALANARRSPQAYASVRALVLGGEQAMDADLRLFQEVFSPTAILINGLGPTECTLAMQQFLDASSTVTGPGLPVGWPVRDATVSIVNEDGQEVGRRALGEMVIGSPYLALGYWDDAALTAAKFHTDEQGRRWYRTGDYGKRLPSGAIEYVGRRDLQVKLRGMRVELGEVQAVVDTHKDVRECAVCLQGEGDRPELVAYCVTSEQVDLVHVRRHVETILPPYMVPSRFVQVASLPLLPNGKLDRKGLEEPLLQSLPETNTVANSVAEPTGMQAKILALWLKALRRSQVGIHENFFDAGGNSLLLAEVHAAMQDHLEMRCSLMEMLQHPTIHMLSTHLRGQGRSLLVRQ